MPIYIYTEESFPTLYIYIYNLQGIVLRVVAAWKKCAAVMHCVRTYSFIFILQELYIRIIIPGTALPQVVRGLVL